MSIGNFDETNESKDEVNETTDNTEKPRNQILEIPDSYKDDFESKLDSKESKEAERTEQDYDNDEGKEDNGNSEKNSLLDKMLNLFKKKDIEESDRSEQRNEGESVSDTRKDFLDSLRVDSPSMEEQVEAAKERENKHYEANSEVDGTEDSTDTYEHGEDDERTRWSDAQWSREHDFE